jgi:hypothetical protein
MSGEQYDGYDVKDTIVIPAHPLGFQEVFIEKLEWPNLKIKNESVSLVKYIAVYQAKPVSAITHYGVIKEFVALEKKGRYQVKLEMVVELENAVKFGKYDTCGLQGPRYTTLNKIKSAGSLDSAF